MGGSRVGDVPQRIGLFTPIQSGQVSPDRRKLLCRAGSATGILLAALFPVSGSEPGSRRSRCSRSASQPELFVRIHCVEGWVGGFSSGSSSCPCCRSFFPTRWVMGSAAESSRSTCGGICKLWWRSRQITWHTRSSCTSSICRTWSHTAGSWRRTSLRLRQPSNPAACRTRRSRPSAPI